MSTLFLVRHGESEWNRAGRIQGQADSPLTEQGVQQAHAIGECLAQVLGAVTFTMYASPLGRARQTAAVIAGYLGRESEDIYVDERINDFNLGEISGYPGWDKVAQDHPELARLRLQDPHRFHPPNGESGADMDGRLRAFLSELADDGAAALIVSHGVVNKFIRSIARGLHGPQIIALDELQDAVYRLDYDVETVIRLSS